MTACTETQLQLLHFLFGQSILKQKRRKQADMQFCFREYCHQYTAAVCIMYRKWAQTQSKRFSFTQINIADRWSLMLSRFIVAYKVKHSRQIDCRINGNRPARTIGPMKHCMSIRENEMMKNRNCLPGALSDNSDAIFL